MKKILLFLVLLQICTFYAFSQNKVIRLKNGNVKMDEDLRKPKFFTRHQKDITFHNRAYVLVQLNKAPDVATRNELKAKGILLYNLISSNTFFAEIKQDNITSLPQSVSGVYNLPAELKIDKALSDDPEISDPHTMIAVMFFGSETRENIKKEIATTGATIQDTKIDPANVIFVKASEETIQKIAGLPFVSYVGKQKLKDVPLNYNNRAAHGLDALNAVGGRNLQGKGVTVGVGDDANPATHVDFGTRLLVRTPVAASNHGTHVTGTVGGAGLLNPLYKGMAPQATIINQYFSDILVNTPVYYSDNHLVLSNNSYYSGADNCPGDGVYNVLSNYIDNQLNTFPKILHVFAAGNDGANTCASFPQSYATIKSGYQCSKNVLTVGNIDNNYNYTINGGSSRGPVNDGRLKPEIVAGGTNIISTTPNNSYGSKLGTSMSSPTVTGTLALLYERYRQLNGGADPNGALIKAIVCNAAEDKGSPGPDYTYGFGNLNARRAVEAIEKQTYFSGTINNGQNQTYTISNIPQGAQVKVMLYWSDPEAVPNAVKTLVNDLDLTVTDGVTLHHPLILNPANVTANAVEGVDNTNNIEQVVVTNAQAGDYTIGVNGTNIPTATQDYVVVYQILPPSVTVDYPFGNETLVPGTTENIRWSYYGTDGNNTFSADYSIDNGATWTNIRNNIRGDSMLVAWTIPAVATNEARIRITRNNAGYSDISDYNFTILGQPTVNPTTVCTGYVQLTWGPIAGATSYDVMVLRGDSMQVIASNVVSPFVKGGFSKDSTYYFSVRPNINGSPGRRSTALSTGIKLSGGSCSLPVFANNFGMDSLISPATGRQFTSSALLSTTPITMRIRNASNTASSGSYDISYQVNNGTIFTETSSTSIPANSTANYTFINSTYDFSGPGTYTLKTWIKHIGDTQTDNDSLTTIVKQLANAPLNLITPFTEDFESAAEQTLLSKTMGFTGLDRADFNTNSTMGRARTFVNTGFARSGNRCVTLDKTINTAASASDSLTLTFNLSNYSATDQLWLNFFYKNHGIDFSLPGNQVWIRGNDASAWVPVYTLPTIVADFGIYKAAPGVNITEILNGASQAVSGSFQVRFGEQGYTSANSVVAAANLDDGYSFDDITISEAMNDVGMKALQAPDTMNLCNLSNAETVKVLLKNYTNTTLTDVPITYSINGVTVPETINSLPPGDFTYTFNQKADFSAFQKYTVTAWVKSNGDTYANNDTLHPLQFHTAPLVSTFPYMEGFENNDGHWYADGYHSSWAWGTPSKPVIKNAANGSKIWTTNLTGNYNANELSYLYSPCFDVSALNNPMLSFSHIFELEACNCDAHWVEYSTDGVTWNKLGAANKGTNWYNNSSKNVWQQPSLKKWHVASIGLPKAPKLRLRFVMNSDPESAFDGPGIDDINVFDSTAIYTGPDITSGISQPVSGNVWIDLNDASGKRIASINANGQTLGNTLAKVFFNPNTPIVRSINNQYYLDRNIVIQPANPPTDSVGVRFYFLDAEAQKLMSATGCVTCSTISDPYESGITQYSGPITEEDGTWSNNKNGVSRFILPQTQVKIIPYNNGYYAEYKVARFSEFWINSGGPDQNTPLPLTLLSFNAIVKNAQGILSWETDKEINTLQFTIEKSIDGIAFNSIGTVKAYNNNAYNKYSFIDSNLVYGKNYYRLKMIDIDGKFQYSPIRVINFAENNFTVMVYPNPVVSGVVNIKTSVNCSKLALKDATGKQLKAVNVSGKQNTLHVAGISQGLYFLTINTDAGTQTEKIMIK